MADTSLPDLLSGAVGAPVNRPQLNAFIARSQAQNGLTSAQTQDAMIKAQQGQEELDAHAKVDDALADMYPDMKPSERTLSKAALIGALGGSSETAVKALGLLKAGNGNPQQQVSGFQQYTGEPVKPLAVPPTYEAPVAPPGGSAYGPPQQTVEGAAHTAAETANANLHQNQSDNPSLFHPGGQQTKIDPVQAQEIAQFIRENPSAAGNLRGLVAGGAGADIIHAYMHPDGSQNSAPVNGIQPAAGVSLKEQAAIRNDFASGPSGKQAGNLGTMVQHSQLFDLLADQMGNGNFAPTNYINQTWLKVFGSPAPGNLQTAGAFLGREAVRATINAGAGTGQERELDVNANSSPDQLHGAADTLRSLATGQARTLELRARRGGVDMSQLLVPEAQNIFNIHPSPVAAPHAPAGDGDNSAVGLPSYNDVESAIAAGHKSGDKVIIGGNTGTLQ